RKRLETLWSKGGAHCHGFRKFPSARGSRGLPRSAFAWACVGRGGIRRVQRRLRRRGGSGFPPGPGGRRQGLWSQGGIFEAEGQRLGGYGNSRENLAGASV